MSLLSFDMTNPYYITKPQKKERTTTIYDLNKLKQHNCINDKFNSKFHI